MVADEKAGEDGQEGSRREPGNAGLVMTRPATTVQSASTEPTERSMPPRRMTKVMPTAITVLMLIWVKMLLRLAKLTQNAAQRWKKTMQNSTRARPMPASRSIK